jgi:hypothetical protein
MWMGTRGRGGIVDQAGDLVLAAMEGMRTEPADSRRAELVTAARERWVSALTDLGGRNTLLYFKDRRAGTLDLAAADPDAVDRLLRMGSIRLTRLFHDVDIRADAIRRVQAIYRKARELTEECGLAASYLATGLARWDELFLEPAAPVLLHKLSTTYGADTEGLADEVAGLALPPAQGAARRSPGITAAATSGWWPSPTRGSMMAR